ncbi:MAG: hypothetical protein QW244_01515 [Candidatus Pacearchaeota archaeon]
MRIKFKIIGKKEEKQIVNFLAEYGIKISPNFVFLRAEKKIFIAPRESVNFLPLAIRAGFYLGKLEHGGFRLSFDATQLFATQIKKFISINDDEFAKWMQGLSLKKEKKEAKEEGFIVLKHNNDFLGCGLIKKNKYIKILNYTPKERRIKENKEER